MHDRGFSGLNYEVNRKFLSMGLKLELPMVGAHRFNMPPVDPDI
jgi:hypothetical protein